jgi:predicted phosphodiesterase
MRYAVISDIHSNLEALKAVLSDIDKGGVDEIVSLGDIVGYNADPVACLDLVMGHGIRSVIGNHDRLAAGGEEPSAFNVIAAEALIWTRERLSDAQKGFLKGLPATLVVDGSFLIAHGSLYSTDEYVSDVGRAALNLARVKEFGLDVSFLGHTHIPAAYELHDGEASERPIGDFLVKRGEASAWLVNPGAIGQPRDFDPRAAYVVYDAESRRVKFKRVEYDVELAGGKIIKAGLPMELAKRLREGR